MFRFQRRRTSAPPRITTSFRALQRVPFEEQHEPTYATHRVGHAYALEIRKTNLFCWSLLAERGQRDFVVVADLEHDARNAASAAGLILRYLDPLSFYYFLVSNQGRYRFDLVLNGNRFPLLDWTPSPLLATPSVRLRVICRGAWFGFCVDEELIAELEDDRIESGALGLAAQNYNEAPASTHRFTSFSLDATPLEVERAYERWGRVLSPADGARARLARTLAAMGRTEGAIVQLNKALRESPGAPEDYLLLARLTMATGLYQRALEAVERSLTLAPDNLEALVEKTEILYALNRLPEARDLAASLESRGELTPVYMVRGNSEYALGNWRAAADAYAKVWAAERSPLAALNAARCHDRLGEVDRALELYVAAAGMYHRRGSLAELEVLVAELKGAHGGRPEVRSLDARLKYWRGDEEGAGRELERLVDEGVRDSEVWYLHGLVLSRRGRRAEALRSYERAVELEPDAGVYWFRLAEARHLLGMDPDHALETALRLAPEDGWTVNLQGLVHASRGELEPAEVSLTRASELLPDSPEVAANLGDVLHRRGRSAEALELLEAAIARTGGHAGLVNQRGTILAATGDLAGAHAEYEKALRLEPANPDYLENCARVAIELDLVSRAEECLRRLLDLRPTASAYNLLGNVAALQRQHDRAEAAYREGLRMEPDDADLLGNLAALLVRRGSEEGARAAIRALETFAAGSPVARARAGRMLEQFRARFEVSLRCSCCGREWWAPRDPPVSPPLRARGDPPDHAPVGACPDCGRIWCASCARPHVVDNRFTCGECGVPLKMTDPRLVHLFRRAMEDTGGESP